MNTDLSNVYIPTPLHVAEYKPNGFGGLAWARIVKKTHGQEDELVLDFVLPNVAESVARFLDYHS